MSVENDFHCTTGYRQGHAASNHRVLFVFCHTRCPVKEDVQDVLASSRLVNV